MMLDKPINPEKFLCPFLERRNNVNSDSRVKISEIRPKPMGGYDQRGHKTAAERKYGNNEI